LLQPFYNAHLVVAALPRVVARFPDVRLVLGQYMADQEYRAALARQVDSLGLASHVVFVPLLPTERMPELFSLAAVVVAVPPSDGLPLTMLEAICAASPT
jgi:glycosyltransferase involved in cell wall biosynthesis